MKMERQALSAQCVLSTRNIKDGARVGLPATPERQDPYIPGCGPVGSLALLMTKLPRIQLQSGITEREREGRWIRQNSLEQCQTQKIGAIQEMLSERGSPSRWDARQGYLEGRGTPRVKCTAKFNRNTQKTQQKTKKLTWERCSFLANLSLIYFIDLV